MSARAKRFRCLIWLWAALAACTPARQKVGGSIVRDIAFDGNGGAFSGHNDLQLNKQLEQESTAFGLMVPLLRTVVEPKLLERDVLVRDAYRLEVWYAHHGWFDAQVLGWQVRDVRSIRPKRAGIVDVRGKIETGEPSLVRAYTTVGETPSTRTLARSALRTGYLKPDRQFDLDLAEIDRAKLQVQLQRSGFAYARVDLSMDAFPEQHAVDVQLAIEPGPSAVYGPITIEGDERVRRKFIEQNLRIQQGSPYRLDDLTGAQNRLFDMGTFGQVSVLPDLSDPTRKDVPIRVSVDENKPRSLKFGVGLKLEALQGIEPNVSARFRHANLFEQLIGVDLFQSVGAANSATSGTGTGLVPVYQTRASLLYPRMFGQKVAQQLQVDVVRGVQQGLGQYFNPQADFRSIWKPVDFLAINLGPHVEQFEYLELQDTTPDNPTEIAARRLFGGDELVQVYRITSVDFSLSLDWRDDPLTAKRGSFVQTTTRLAFPLTEKDYAYGAFTGDWRLFRPVRIGGDVPLTLATRVYGKVLVPLGNSSLPYPELAFLGGSSSMRGFPSRGLGPYTTFAVPVVDNDGNTDTRRYFVPRGGNIGAVVSEELRFYGGYGITWAAFVDAATLANPGRSYGDGPPDPLFLALQKGFRIAAGAGVRYGSPIGPIRLDIALRPRYEEDCGPTGTAPTACKENLDQKRRIDLIHSVDKSVESPPAVMLFVAFGEMI
jgi:outer membrane protein assembly factor BamA